MSKSEAKTREDLIDPAIEKAGWKLNDKTQVDIEIPVDGHKAEPWNGITDYVLFRENGEVLAVVEAKKTTHQPRLAQQQTEHYITEIEKHQSFRPFAFMTNGIDIYFMDNVSAPRLVKGFFSRDDLERLLMLRAKRQSLTSVPANKSIVNRDYQLEAVKRIGEAFEQQRKRKSLLVMATGTGKTRTAMAIVDIFIRTNQAQHILFVADRDALVEQALNDGFEKHISTEPCIRLRSTNLEEAKTNRLLAVTLQTLSNVFEQFTPGFFDLIIFDEVHRSIFNKWDEVLEYFDALMIGLTATPASFIDRNTFIKFDCFDGTPAFLYTYEEAIEDSYLVDFRLYRAETHFQSDGIRGYELAEEDRNALIEQGLDPDDIDFEGTELEKTVTNRDTLRRQWQEILEVCLKDKSGQLPGKMIVFAMTQDHAIRLLETFEEMYPQWSDMAAVITHKSEYRGQAIKKFKKEDMPRIVISVNMLETGVDVPEVVNLVFMTPVKSQIKKQQMIGRGTRVHEACLFPDRLPDGHKQEFLIIDFWENDFSKQAEDAPASSLPVLVSLFNTRLKRLETLLKEQQSDEFVKLVAVLREQIALIPIDSYSVKSVYRLPEVQEAWSDHFWRYITNDKIILLRNKVGPLLRYVSGVDIAGTTFTHKVERLKHQIVENRDASTLVNDIAEDVSRLPDFVFEDAQCKSSIDLALSGKLDEATPEQLNLMIDVLAGKMKHKRKTKNRILELDLEDYIASGGYVVISRTGEQVYVDEYRKRVENHITQMVMSNPVVVAALNGDDVSDNQLIELERSLRRQLAGDPLELTDINIRRAYGRQVASLLTLLRQVLDLDPAVMPDYQDIVERQFDAFIREHDGAYNADQLRFLRAMKAVLARQRKIELTDLYEAPFTAFGQDAVERWFTDDEIDEIMDFASTLAA
jgi:type I restriction enzyme R subunit